MARSLDLDHFRQLLQRERERMLHQIRANTDTESESDSLSELSDYDDHPADVATETFEREKERALRDNARETVGRIDAATHKLEQGTYGVCDICGQEIPAGRLEAAPYATLCVKCQSDIENP